jgi:hypothetical protein
MAVNVGQWRSTAVNGLRGQLADPLISWLVAQQGECDPPILQPSQCVHPGTRLSIQNAPAAPAHVHTIPSPKFPPNSAKIRSSSNTPNPQTTDFCRRRRRRRPAPFDMCTPKERDGVCLWCKPDRRRTSLRSRLQLRSDCSSRSQLCRLAQRPYDGSLGGSWRCPRSTLTRTCGPSSPRHGT